MKFDPKEFVLTYTARRRIRRTLTAVGVTVLVAVLVWLCWFMWLERFVVYTDEGVRLDFDYQSPEGTAVVAEPPVEETVAIYFNEGTDELVATTELGPIRGYYVNYMNYDVGPANLQDDIEALPAGSAVMFDLKNGKGNFYYSSQLSEAPITKAIDVDQVDDLIATLSGYDIYLIARVSALRDWAYGLEHVSQGLPTAEGYLWIDEGSCYWLDPASSAVQSRLITIAAELRELGFDEVVFTDFEIPATDEIVFEEGVDPQVSLSDAAQTLVTTCATSRFAVSFESSDPAFPLPQGRSRLFLRGITADAIAATMETVSVTDPTINLVLLTEANDTRFDAGSVMRPLPAAAE